MTERDCARLRELAAELALGVLSGQERAEALAHVNRCPACQEYLRDLTSVADGLLSVVPVAEPPVGFEDRVLARLGVADRPRRWPRVPLAVAAAVAAVVFGVFGWLIGTLDTRSGTELAVGPPTPSTGAPAEADLLRGTLVAADRHPIGKVFAYAEQPSWMYVAVSGGRYTGTVSCELTNTSGATVWVGSFALTDGAGYWGTPVPVTRDSVGGVRLVTVDGTVLATATLGH